MITVFMTDEAQDMMLEEFEKNGFHGLCEDEWTSDILLEPIEACMSIRCRKMGEEENYQKEERFFPPTVNLRALETITAAEKSLEEIHGQVGAFLDGEVKVPGIPTDEDYGWLRNAVLYRRLVIPYARKHIEDGSFCEQEENAGVYIRREEDKIISEAVSGKDRPELFYARLTEKGAIVEEPGRYYEDELFTEAKLRSAIQELANRPQFLDIDGNGDRMDWPPQLLEEYQYGRLLMDGRLRKIELGSKVVPVVFKRKDFLWQHPKQTSVERIYVTVDTLMKLPEVEIPIKRIPEELRPEAIVEVVDCAFTCIIELEGVNLKNTKLSLYNRFGIPLLSPVRAEAAGICEGAKLFLEDGRFGADGEGYLGDVAFSLLFGYRKLLGVLIAADWFAKHGRNENAQSGILIECNGETLSVRRVTGTQRPEMICSAPEDERVFYRPYQDDEEYAEADIRETVTVKEILDLARDPAELLIERLRQNDRSDDLEQELAKGNPQAMKLRAQKLLEGEPTSEDKKQALAWYEKAAALLSGDDDLEFEIFMLKMELDTQ